MLPRLFHRENSIGLRSAAKGRRGVRKIVGIRGYIHTRITNCRVRDVKNLHNTTTLGVRDDFLRKSEANAMRRKGLITFINAAYISNEERDFFNEQKM